MVKKVILNILTIILKQFIKILPPKVIFDNQKLIAKKFEKYSNAYFTYHLRPKLSDNINHIKAQKNKNNELTAIVLQGPLDTVDNFTLETCKIYLKTFTNAIIIVSTWEGECKETIKLLRDLGVFVLLNHKPHYSGPLNINYQIYSTLQGIKFAKEKNASYILKTRCDQRFYKEDLDGFFLSLLHQYPISEKYLKFMQNRIITLSFTTLKYRPYSVSDMMQFGHIDDLYNYWNINFDHRTKGNDSGETIIDFAKKRYAETYICTEFLKKISWDLKWTIQDSWRVYKEFYIIIDYHSLDFFWHKYNTLIEHKYLKYSNSPYDLFTFNNWISESEQNFEEHSKYLFKKN